MKRIRASLLAASERVVQLVNKELTTIGQQIRQDIIIPFCTKIDCDFKSSNGHWSFLLRYPVPVASWKWWYVGEDRRPLPGNPGGLGGEEDRWWADVTDEERQLKELLDSYPDWASASGRLSWHIDSFIRPIERTPCLTSPTAVPT